MKLNWYIVRTLSDKEVLDLSIEHHERMLQYAQKQAPNAFALEKWMRRDIGEDWHAQFCACCVKYTCKVDPFHPTGMECESCPLGRMGYGCEGRWHIGRPPSPWMLLARARSWSEFALASENMIRVLKRVRDKVVEEESEPKQTQQLQMGSSKIFQETTKKEGKGESKGCDEERKRARSDKEE